MDASLDISRALKTSIRGLPSAHRLEAPSQTPSLHVATYPGSRSPAS